MFERFNNQSRRVVVLAQEEARAFNHNYIGTEHLLLGLLREGEGTAAKALTSLDVTLEGTRGELETIIGRGQHAPSGHIPFTPRAKKSLELSLRECLELGDSYIGTGHLLLGLIRQGESVAVQILGKLGTDLNDLRGRVIQELRDHPEQASVAPAPDDPMQQRIGVRPRREINGLLDTIEQRLSAIEQHLGITRKVPDELRRLDEQIAGVRRDKEAAIDSQDFEQAATLRDAEKRLLTERQRVEREMEAGGGDGAETDTGMESDKGAGPGGAAGPGEAPQAGAGTEAGESAGTSEVSGTGDDAGAVEGAVKPDEVTWLRTRLARLEAQLREHGIEPGEPQEPPAAAG
jgi:Clp amino terminal domain, pathogenicity island component/UvrB/uvrC motif